MRAPLPAEALLEFPRLGPLSEADFAVVASQLGRPPRGDVFVAARCRHGRPYVILTVPFDIERKPTPPLLWLTCPHASRQMSRLEGDGAARRFMEALEPGGEAAVRFLAEEERFGAMQVRLAEGVSEELARRVRGRGVAGGQPRAVKCLHAHLAYRLASGRGVVGGWCLEELVKSVGRICDGVPATCVDRPGH